MGFYNVVKPCVVARRHHVRPTTQPIEVDDDTAAPLVESGCLEPYQPGGVEGRTGTVLDREVADDALRHFSPASADAVAELRGTAEGEELAAEARAALEPESTPRPRGRRRSAED